LLPSLLSFSSIPHPTPTSTLFPYTTLFRSQPCQPVNAQPPPRPKKIKTHDWNPRAGRRRVLPYAICHCSRGPGPAHRLQWQMARSEEHTSELQSPYDLVCRLLLEKKKKKTK